MAKTPTTKGAPPAVRHAYTELKKGKPIILYDGEEREGEADIVFHAKHTTPKRIEQLRKDAGGLICLALDRRTAKKLNLPFYTNMLAASGLPVSKMKCTKTAYGDSPAFSLPINHKKVYTGITDNDRTLTIKKMAELVDSANKHGGSDDAGIIFDKFVSEFYSPGHIFLLIGSGIENRRGHTELALELARRAGMSGAMILCEMLGSGKALSRKKAMGYAKRNNMIFIDEKEII